MLGPSRQGQGWLNGWECTHFIMVAMSLFRLALPSSVVASHCNTMKKGRVLPRAPFYNHQATVASFDPVWNASFLLYALTLFLCSFFSLASPGRRPEGANGGETGLGEHSGSFALLTAFYATACPCESEIDEQMSKAICAGTSGRAPASTRALID